VPRPLEGDKQFGLEDNMFQKIERDAEVGNLVEATTRKGAQIFQYSFGASKFKGGSSERSRGLGRNLIGISN